MVIYGLHRLLPSFPNGEEECVLWVPLEQASGMFLLPMWRTSRVTYGSNLMSSYYTSQDFQENSVQWNCICLKRYPVYNSDHLDSKISSIWPVNRGVCLCSVLQLLNFSQCIKNGIRLDDNPCRIAPKLYWKNKKVWTHICHTTTHIDLYFYTTFLLYRCWIKIQDNVK